MSKKQNYVEDAINYKDQWEKTQTQEKEKAKFIPKGRSVRIYHDRATEEIEIDGKFGKQKMFVIPSNIGLVYVSKVQFIDIVNRFKMANWSESIEYP